jgi:hypothetical protein
MAVVCGLPLLTLTVTVEVSLMVPVTATNDWTVLLLSAGAETASTGAFRS